MKLLWFAMVAVTGVAGAAWGQATPANLCPNGGLEEGTGHWVTEPGAALDTARAHSGKAALLLTCAEPGQEMQATSEAMQAVAGKRYRLNAWVWQVAGGGSYKVTVDWRDASGAHLSYDNDWQDNNHPAAYTQHGGTFAAPARAAGAAIILGVKDGACLFDDIALVPASQDH